VPAWQHRLVRAKCVPLLEILKRKVDVLGID